MGLRGMLQEKLELLASSPELESRWDAMQPKFNSLGYDSWGTNFQTVRHTLIVLKWLYEEYFRVEAYGIDKVPPKRVLLISNHSGKLPWDAALLAYALFRYTDPPRLLRNMIARFMPQAPFLSSFMTRCGQVLGEPSNCKLLLEQEEAVLVFPEGSKGSAKLYWNRYELQKFGHGFMRIALETNTPIVPVAVIGAEEIYPSFYNSRLVARVLGLPFFPFTPFWPWFGPLGIIPIPTKIRLYFGEPIVMEGDFDATEEEIAEKVDIIKNKIQALLHHGLSERQKILS